MIFYFSLITFLSIEAQSFEDQPLKKIGEKNSAQNLRIEKDIRVLSGEKNTTDKKQKLTLSKELFLKEVLASSPYIKKLQLSIKQAKAQILQSKYSLSDWGFYSEWKKNNKKNPSIDKFLSAESDSQNLAFGLQKKIPYGFEFNSTYVDYKEDSINEGFLKQFKPESIYRKSFNLEFKTNLTESISHFWLLKSFEKSLSIQDLSYYEKSEQLILEALAQYWKTYLSYMKLQQAKAGLQTYKKLVRETNRKQKYKFLQPGERPQILAEYQSIQSGLDLSEQDYKKEIEALFLYLKKDSKKYDLVFDEKSFINLSKNRDSFKEIEIEKTRAFQIQKKLLESQKLNLSVQKSSLYPSVELLGKKAWTPAGESSALGFSSKAGFYEFGFSLKWILFSKSFYQQAAQKKYELEESEIDFELAKKELKNQILLTGNQVKIAHRNIERAKKANEYRKKTFQELRVSFNQGRTDTFQLLQAEKHLRESEVQKAMALSKYSLSLAGFLALRDELIEKYITK